MLKIAVVGAGNRGTSYTRILAQMKEQIIISAIAEPITAKRIALAELCGNPQVRLFDSWESMADCGEKVADAVIIATQDSMHVAPAIAFAGAGYHILLEKPMAPTYEECCRIVEAVKKSKICFAVCHVLRYTPYVKEIKRLLESHCIGELVSIQHLESVVYWHQAHGFVRGNWRNTQESSCMLLQKSCHDMDLMSYFADRKCIRTSSFGSLKLFRREEQPSGAADRCLDCAKEAECAYSALKIYWRDRAAKGHWDWPVDILTMTPTKEALFDALRKGPYGRCVYACDNDVVDHQVVNLEFAGGVTVNFTMTAFTPLDNPRRTLFFGTQGMIEGDGRKLTVYNYLDDSRYTIDSGEGRSGNIADGHGGGDAGLINAFVRAVAMDDASGLSSDAAATLESHRIVFKSEEARLSGKVIELD